MSKTTLILICMICAFFGCQTEKTTPNVHNEEIRSVIKTEFEEDSQINQLDSGQISAELLKKAAAEKAERERAINLFRTALRSTCISTGTGAFHVVMIVEPNGKPSFAEIYDLKDEKVKQCINARIRATNLNFGQISSLGSKENKFGRTRHKLVIK